MKGVALLGQLKATGLSGRSAVSNVVEMNTLLRHGKDDLYAEEKVEDIGMSDRQDSGKLPQTLKPTSFDLLPPTNIVGRKPTVSGSAEE